MSEEIAEYRRRMILQGLQRQDDQLLGEFDTTKGGPVLTLLARSRLDAAIALDEMLGMIRAGATPADDNFQQLGRKIAMHFSLVGYAQGVHVAGKNAYLELQSDDLLDLKQAIVPSHGGDTTVPDD